MMISQDEMFRKCEELGEAKVRENLNSNVWNSGKRNHAEEWLRQVEVRRAQDVLSRQESREIESIKIAREANSIALSARDDARSAKCAAWVAAIFAVVAIIVMVIELLIKSPK